jgi:hypothetical protein
MSGRQTRKTAAVAITPRIAGIGIAVLVHQFAPAV